ncbi:MAG: methyltransferase domain-containing protein [Rhizobiales bacterium]|nr:methyltransferase domain-containing protein [Hyphomicrobiales bacterium]
MGAEFEKNAIARTYSRWAPIYDFVFGKVFERGRAAAVDAAERIGGRILEVGVGTGISLPGYSRTNRVVGLDISEPMLRKAQQRIHAQSLDHIDGLAVMDAARLAFPDKSFDVVVGQYLITAVPDPEATLDEFARVLRPGGEIVLVNHLAAERGARRLLEQGFAPAARRLGWQPDFGWERLARWAERRSDIRLVERRPVPPLDHFSLMRFGRMAALL